MKKIILPICLGLVLVILLVGGIIISENVIKNYDDVPFIGSMTDIFGKYDSYEEMPSANLAKIDDNNKLVAAYKVVKDGKEFGYAYLAEMASASFNKEHINILYGCEKDSKKLLGLAVISADANDYYYVDTYRSSFDDLEAELAGLDMSEGSFGNSLTAVTGATYSRNAIVEGAKLARIQFYIDIEEALPVSFEYVSNTQIFTDITNICSFEYLFNNKNKGADCKVVVKMNPTTKEFTYVSDDSNLSEDDIAACMALIEGNKPINYISNMTVNAENPSNYDITVITKGFSGNITITMTISNTAIVDFAITSSNESYEHGGGYQGTDPILTAPDDVINNQNNFADWTVCTGATVTQNAIKNAVTQAYKLIDVLGGNE